MLKRRNKTQSDWPIGRYGMIAAAALAAGRSADAGLITTVFPTPVDLSVIGSHLDINLDNSGLVDLNYTGMYTIFGTGFTSTGTGFGTGFSGPDLFVRSGAFWAPVAVGSFGFFHVGDLINPPNVTSTSFVYPGAITIEGMFPDSKPGPSFMGFGIYGPGTTYNLGFVESNGLSVIGYAYETNPDTAITTFDLATVAPEPETLSLLALGAAGLALFRRKRNPAE